MRKNLIVLSTLLGVLVYSQKNNEVLRREFEQQKIQNEKSLIGMLKSLRKSPDAVTKKK